MMKKRYTKKQITESETGFDHQPPTALELVEAVFGDEDYSQKLALQARVWVEVEAPHGKRLYDSGMSGTGIKRGLIVPWLFPVVDVKQRGRSKIALVCSKPSMHHEALTFMELKSKFLDAKVRRDDVVTAECGGLPVGDIVAVNVRAGRIPGEGRYYGGGQHVVVIKCVGSQEFTKSRDEGRLGAADIRESSHKYAKKQITEAIAYWEKQLNESSLLTWQLGYDRLSLGEPIPKLNKDKNLVLVNDKCGNMLVPDTVTIGELYDTIKDFYKNGRDRMNIEFVTRV